MPKYSGSYQSVLKGVSEQIPQDRFEGQHYEQTNFISDLSGGLARRQGSVFQTEIDFGEWFVEANDDTLADIQDYRSIDFQVAEDRFCMFFRQKAKPALSVAPFCFCVNKDTRQMVPVEFDVDALVAAVQSGGASSVATVGRYVFIAGNTIVPTYTSTDNFNSVDNEKKGVTWIRLGAYSRKFEMSFTVKNTVTLATEVINVSYTTLGASYPNPLDTSGIPFSDPEYQKLINDAVNDYNGLVTQWIGLAGADVVATNIAVKLRDEIEIQRLALADPTCFTCEIHGSTIGIVANGDWIIEKMNSSDNGDKTLMRTVFESVTDAAQLSAEHYAGKVVKVIPKKTNGSDGYYVIAKARTEGAVGLVEVQWDETAAISVMPEDVLVYATVEAGTLYLASSAAGLEALAPTIDTNFIGFKDRQVGDNITSPIPNFFGKKITYLGVFQDRLVIASGGVLTFSRSGDYLNWFRESVLTLPDDDPLEIFALGSEDDTIVHSTYFDKNFVLFGKRKQYAIDGRRILTPQSPLITIISQHEDAVDAPPVGSGNFVFYTKLRKNITTLHQFQLGNVADSPESYENTLQLSRYLVGKPVEILPVTTPNTVFLRTIGNPYGLYVWNYLDTSEGRQFDAWSKWSWDPLLGVCVGMTWDSGDLLIATARHGNDRFATDRWFLVIDQFSLDTDLSDKPYLDSMRPLNAVEAAVPARAWMHNDSDIKNSFDVAFDNTVSQFLLGQGYELKEKLTTAYPGELGAAWVGLRYSAVVVPTNPYIRDSKGKAIVSARTVIARYKVTVKETAGMRAYITTKGRGEYQSGAGWTGREIGRLSSTLGIQPIANGDISVPIGKANSEFTYKLASMTWLPITITAIEWTGQFYSHTRRV